MSEQFKFNQKRYKFNFDAMPHKRWELGLTPYEFMIFEWIWHRCFNGEGECFEKHKSIYTRLGISEKQFYRSLKALEEKNVIARQTEKGVSSSISVIDQEFWATPKPMTSVCQTEPLCPTDRTPLSDRQTSPPSPKHININKKERIRSIEQECRISPPEGSLTPPSGATQDPHHDPLVSEIEIKPIEACVEIVEGNRIAQEENVPSCVSNEPIEASVDGLGYGDLVRQWRELLFEISPTRRSSPPNVKKWSQALKRVSAYTGLDEQGLVGVLDFIKNDHDPHAGKDEWPGWRTIAISPEGLMGKLKNGEKKIDKILRDMERKKTAVRRLTKAEAKAIATDTDAYFIKQFAEKTIELAVEQFYRENPDAK